MISVCCGRDSGLSGQIPKRKKLVCTYVKPKIIIPPQAGKLGLAVRTIFV
jgi:hypothetical protein